MFFNPEVPVDALPQADAVEWQPLHPRYAREQQIVRGLAIVLIALGFSGIAMFRGPTFFPFAPIAIVGVLAAAALITWPAIALPRCGYALRERDMVYRHGVIFRKVTTVPFNRIQHVEVSHGPIDRRFGIGTLKLYTAGGSGGDLSVGGLPTETAERLRDFILSRAGAVVERD